MEENLDNYIEAVCKAIASDPQSDFSKKSFLNILKLLPSVPNVPGADVFYELAKKSIPVAIDMVLLRDKKVLLVKREDKFYDGWHFPGFYRKPYTPLLDDCKDRVKAELGGNIEIISVKPIAYMDHIDNHRFHDFGILSICQFEGEPDKGEWFSEMPKMINIQEKYLEIIKPYLK